jgi:hypothetical protein
LEVVWFGIAIICFAIWAVISIRSKIKGDRFQRKAQELAAAGDWEQASLCYKQAIITRLDSRTKVPELTRELSELYKSHGHDTDLSSLLECPEALKTLGAGTRNQKKKNELIAKVHLEAKKFLNTLPGPQVPDE